MQRGKTRKRSLSQTHWLPLPLGCLPRKPVFSSPQWGFSILPLLASGAGEFTAVGSCPGHCRVPPSIPGLYSLNANSTLRIFKPPLMASKISGWQIKGFSFLLFTSLALPNPSPVLHLQGLAERKPGRRVQVGTPGPQAPALRPCARYFTSFPQLRTLLMTAGTLRGGCYYYFYYWRMEISPGNKNNRYYGARLCCPP